MLGLSSLRYPFALNLKMDAQCFQRVPAVDKFLKDSHFVNKARAPLHEAARGAARHLSKNRRMLKQKGVQKEFADRFKSALLPSTLVNLLKSRFNKHFANLCPTSCDPCWQETMLLLKVLRCHSSMVALTTLLNSWCTRGRYHDDSAELCIFGCAPEDDIKHYVGCLILILWGICAQASGLPPSDHVEVRLLLRVRLVANLAHLVTAFTVYHAVKLGHATSVADAI